MIQANDDDVDDHPIYRIITIMSYSFFWIWTILLSSMLIRKREYFPIKERSPLLTLVCLYSYLFGTSRDILVLIGSTYSDPNIAI